MKLGISLGILISTLGILHSSAQHSPTCAGKEIYVPYPGKDESHYKVCFSETGDPKEYECPPSLKFNSITRSCTLNFDTEPITKCTSEGDEFPAPDPDCKLRYTCDSDLRPSSTPTACSKDYLFNPLLRECVPDTEYICSDDPPDCSQAKYKNRKWVDKENCEYYYECFGDTIASLKCPSKMYFDAHTQSCLHNTGDICKVPNSNSDLLVNIETICKGKAKEFVPDPYYCKAYYYCVDESTPYWTACADGRYFEKGACSLTKASSCTCEDLKWDGSSSPVNVPHPDRTKYYECTQGNVAKVKTCPSGTTFNTTKKMCSS
ncbi:unnamed protein product [Hermetia illucens]|uniref:Chitin-binding type-2 domain-containing protein n=1 Tax=Hermetia illucens TaxID=343691 RepID=A0A7R8UGW5_HERIL|nr:peritrophin-48-like [Hermetia illucens]CAD7080591.1 unnamed protein product [Hermetia illucens]